LILNPVKLNNIHSPPSENIYFQKDLGIFLPALSEVEGLFYGKNELGRKFAKGEQVSIDPSASFQLLGTTDKLSIFIESELTT